VELNNMGWLHAKLGDYEESAARSKESLRLAQEIDDPYSEAAAWDTLASAHYGLGEFEATILCARWALDVLPEGGDVYNEAMIHERLGDAYSALGDQKAAHTSWRRAVDLYEQVEQPEAEQVRAKLHAFIAPLKKLCSSSSE
jgi:tetratricopeptide (TPR) repeat protein